MRYKPLTVLMIFFTSSVTAHGGAHSSGSGSILPHINPIWYLVGFLALASVIGILLLLTKPEGPEISKLGMGLIVLALITGFTGIFSGNTTGGQKAPVNQIKETYGPAMGPLHMRHFYEEKFHPKEAKYKKDIVHEPSKVPEPIKRNESKTVHITLVAQERVSHLTEDSTYYYWTYNGTVPGPILRVQEGDTVVLTLKNEKSSTHNHSIDLHAVNGPGGGAAVMQVPPGGSKTIRFKALNPGFYVYHCGTDNVPTHIANQMYGGIIVEPKEGLPPVDQQFVVFQGEIYTEGAMGANGFQAFAPKKMINENPTYYTFNGRPQGLTGEHALQAKVNQTVRIFFGNMGNSKISSFHVIGEQFKRYWPHGSFKTQPQGPGVQTVPVAAGSTAVVDMKLNAPGTYVMVDHALARLDRGAWGILKAEGPKQPEIYKGIK